MRVVSTDVGTKTRDHVGLALCVPISGQYTLHSLLCPEPLTGLLLHFRRGFVQQCCPLRLVSLGPVEDQLLGQTWMVSIKLVRDLPVLLHEERGALETLLQAVHL